MLFKNRKGQSTLEFAILIVIIIGALIAMQNFVKRGYQGRLRGATDDMGEQYSPGNTQDIGYTKSFVLSEDRVLPKGVSISHVKDQLQQRSNKERVAKGKFEYWGKADDRPAAEKPDPNIRVLEESPDYETNAKADFTKKIEDVKLEDELTDNIAKDQFGVR